MIAKKFNYLHLSVGDLLREERRSGSEMGHMIEDCIRKGKLVEATVTLGLLERAMKRHDSQKLLIDGFPRNISNLKVGKPRRNNS